ncbi:MAG TPA: hypothetical protein VGC73_06565 [Pyrinomonadaceae bacterium]
MSPNADKQEIRSYLLGTLDTDRRTEFEESVPSVPETYEELLLVEEELIDEYVGGSLSKLERQQFEDHFLITAERHDSLRFGQLLKRYFYSHPVEDPAAVATRHVEKTAPANKPPVFSPSLLGGRPVLAFCVAGVVLLGIALLGWLGYRRPPARSTQRKADLVVVVTLAPGSIATGGDITKQVNVPPKGYNLKLELELKNASFRNYSFELFRENTSVQTSGALPIETKGRQYVVPLTITGEVLSPGDYQLKLSGVLESGANEFIENYSFRVIE